jgi:hypothetical protein
MRRPGTDHDALRARLGTAADWVTLALRRILMLPRYLTGRETAF